MGTKLDLHDYHSPTPTRALPTHLRRRVRRRRPARAYVSLSLAAGGVLLLICAMSPVRVWVDGESVVLRRGTTAAQAAHMLKLPSEAGNLLDVQGRVLRPGEGAGPVFRRNGVSVSATTRLHKGDTFNVIPGYDLTEPLRETATVLKTHPPQGLAEPAVTGMRRVQVGLLSGKTLIETTSALATVPAPSGSSRPKALALTFDDGPHPTQTPAILATLNKNNAKGTFFVLASLVRYYPKTLQQTIAGGHEIAIHSYSHANFARLSAAAVNADMARCQSILQPYVHQPLRLVRPPYGSLSAVSRAALKSGGYKIVMWDVDTNDWRRPGADTIYSRIMNGAAPGRIVLCHDGGGPRSQTIAAIARAVPALKARGYQLLTVSQVLGLQRLPQGGAVVAAGQRWEAKVLTPELAVVLDEQPLVLPEPPMEIAGQLLVPAKALLDGLGVKWQWSQTAQKLTVQGPLETLTLRANSTHLEHQYGPAEALPAPPVIYRGTLMAPLWVVLHASGATALYHPRDNRLSLLSLEQGLQSTKLGQGAPPEWGKHVQWREYLQTLAP